MATRADDVAAHRVADVSRTRLADALVRTGEGDREAFRDIYTLTSAKLFGICVRVCGERAAAQDVLHDVYLTIWKRAGTWQPSRSSPITWLATIARNRAIDWRRAQSRRKIAPLDDAYAIIDPALSPEGEACAHRETRLLHASLDRLEPRQAAALRTAFFEGLSYSELARRSGEPLSTMKSRVRRGLAQLKQHLDV